MPDNEQRLIERLRDRYRPWLQSVKDRKEAADTIERLEAELSEANRTAANWKRRAESATRGDVLPTHMKDLQVDREDGDD